LHEIDNWACGLPVPKIFLAPYLHEKERLFSIKRRGECYAFSFFLAATAIIHAIITAVIADNIAINV